MCGYHIKPVAVMAISAPFSRNLVKCDGFEAPPVVSTVILLLSRFSMYFVCFVHDKASV